MRIIEITALSNGAHRNQTGTFSAVPDGEEYKDNTKKFN